MAENTPATVVPGQLATADQYNTIVGFFNNYGVASYASDPAAPNPGQVWYNSTEGNFKVFVSTPILNKTYTSPTGLKVYALAYDGTYVYAGYSTSPGIVDQIVPSTMTLNKTFTAVTGHDDVLALAYDGTYIYAGCGTNPGVVHQIVPSTMTLNKTFTAVTGHEIIMALTHDGTYIYAGYSVPSGTVDQIIKKPVIGILATH